MICKKFSQVSRLLLQFNSKILHSSLTNKPASSYCFSTNEPPKKRNFNFKKQLKVDKSNQNQQQKLSQTVFSKSSNNWKSKNTSFNSRTCEIILLDYKDIVKQSKKVQEVIKAFYKYKQKLKNNNVQQTQLRLKYKAVMYATALRTFSRILRRQDNPDTQKMLQLVGNNFEKLAGLNISSLKTIELIDLVSFFLLLQILNKFTIISEQKRIVVYKCLAELYNRYKQDNSISRLDNDKEMIDEQSMQGRFISEVIIGARCAQLFQPSFYSKFLDLLQKHLKQNNMVPYKITSIVKFVLRPENLTCVNQQINLLERVLERMVDFQQFNHASLRQFYGNLLSILTNNQGLFEIKLAKQTIQKIQDRFIKILPKIQADQVFFITFIALRNDVTGDMKLAKYIFKNLFDSINQNGQTSLNPSFVLKMLSNISKEQKFKLEQVDLNWQNKIVKLYQRYFTAQTEVPNLTYLFQVQNKLFKQMQSKKIRQVIVQSFQSNKATSIVPYDHESFMLQNYDIQTDNKERIYAQLLRLKGARKIIQKKLGSFDLIFNILEQCFSQDVKKQALQNYDIFISKAKQCYKNRQGYAKVLSKYCQALGHQELITELFYESILEIFQQILPKQKTITLGSLCDSQKVKFTQFLNQKFKQRVNGIFYNYILVLFELNYFFKKQNYQKKDVESLISKNKFFQIIKNHDFLVNCFIEVLCVRQTSSMIYYHDNPSINEFLMKILRYITVGFQSQKEKTQNMEKYYFTFYHIFRNYPMRTLKGIISTEEGKMVAEKMFENYQQKDKKIEALGVNPTHQMNQKVPLNFFYDSKNDKIVINPDHAQILQKKVFKFIQKE